MTDTRLEWGEWRGARNGAPCHAFSKKKGAIHSARAKYEETGLVNHVTEVNEEITTVKEKW